MALINCSRCGKQISDKSNRCIHCGFIVFNDKTKEKINNFGKIYLLIFKFLIWVIIGYILSVNLGIAEPLPILVIFYLIWQAFSQYLKNIITKFRR